MSIPEPKPKINYTSLASWMPLMWLSLAFMAGIWFDSQVHVSIRRWLVLAAFSVILAVFIRVILSRLVIYQTRVSSTASTLIILALTLFFLGAARYQVTVPGKDPFHIAWFADRDFDLVITGTLAGPPDNRDTYTNLRLDTTLVDTGAGDQPVHGLILVRVDPGGSWHYGDVVRVSGQLKTPPSEEAFSYQDYLSRQGILAYMPSGKITRLPFTGGNPALRLVYAIKDRLISIVYKIFPDPEASLLAGILLGDDNGLPADLQQAYKNTGTAHIIAISGFNIAIIAGLFVILFSRLLGPRKGAVVAVIGIILYTVLVGATASVLRAAIMGSLAIFASLLGRRQNGLNTLAATAGFMAVIDPNTLWDAGFQLSFTATLGLILYAQPLQDWFSRLLSRRLPPGTAARIAAPVGEFVLFTLAAQVTTLPVMAYQFGRVSLVSVIANPFVMPAQPVVMVLAGLATLLGFFYLPLGKLVGWIAWPFAAYTDRAVEFFNGFPHGVIVLGEFSLLFVILYYAVLFSLTFPGSRWRQVLRPVLIPSFLITVLGVVVFLVWTAVFTQPDGNLHLTFMDVGSADAILIQSPTGRSILVNGGPSPSQLSSSLGRRLPPFDRRLDWLVVASTADQQVAALPRILDRFPAGSVLWAGPVAASYSSEELELWLSENGVPVIPAYPGAVLDLGSGAQLKVSDISSRGAVLLVEWHSFRALLPVGINFDTLAGVVGGPNTGSPMSPVTALLLADSGLAQTNPPEWIARLHPEVAVLSVAAGDPANLPAQSVLESLNATTLLRTDHNGWITISTDGTRFWVEVERK
jgi:competence protein ComEC